MEESLNLSKEKKVEFIKENESFEESYRESNLQIDEMNQSRISEESENVIIKKDSLKDQNKILEVENDKIFVLGSKEKGKEKEQEKLLTDRQQILEYERQHGDYEKYGVAFDLQHCRITEADSKDMKKIKTLLKRYLQLKGEIEAFMGRVRNQGERKKGKAGMDAIELIYKDRGDIGDHKLRVYFDNSDIGTANREELGPIYDALMFALNTYDGGITLFKRGRARKRLNQVRRVRELLEADNRKYWLSQERRMIKNDGGDERAKDQYGKQWPSYSGFIRNKDFISNRMQRYKDRKRRGERVRFWEGWGRNIGDFSAMMFHGIAGSVERAAALPLMLAGNAIKLSGKILKTPIHLMNGIFNQCCKWAGSRTRWRMDSFKDTWKKGWVSFNDGREAYRRIIMMGVILPAYIPLEAVFLELFQIGRLIKDRTHFGGVIKLLQEAGQVGGKHLRHIIRGMGITSKHYKDRAMLSAEEGGEAAHEWDYGDDVVTE